MQESLETTQIIRIVIKVEEDGDDLHRDGSHDISSCLGQTGESCLRVKGGMRWLMAVFYEDMPEKQINR